MIALPVLKLLLAPAFIVLITLAGRRWGPALAGFLAALPVSAGPVSFFVALEQGPVFAAKAASASIASLGMTSLFCLTYALVARRRAWWQAIAASVVVFFAGALLLHRLEPGLWPAAALVLASIVFTVPRFPVDGAMPTGRVAPPRFDLAWRIAAAVTLTLVVTGLAATIGPRWTGLFTTFPVVSTVLAIFSHRSGPHGAAVAARLLRTLVLGLGSTVAFFLVIGLWLPTLGVAAGYALAVAAALSVQAASALPTLLRRSAA